MTEYVVLRRHGETWEEFTTVTARSHSSAIREAFTGIREAAEDKAGAFVAVPLRSWKPLTVEVETKTALKFS